MPYADDEKKRAVQRFNERRAAGIPIGGPDERKKSRDDSPVSHTSSMPTDIALFDMLETSQLAALDHAALEAELERIHRMLDRVADYQRAVLQVLVQSEKS